MPPNIIRFSRNRWTTAVSSVIGNGGDLTGGGQEGGKQWLQGEHHLGLSTFWMLFPVGKNHQSQQERRPDLRPLAVWPDLPGPCPCSPQIPWTRATRAAAGLPSALAREAEQVRTTPAGAENTPVLDETCLWESSQQNFIMSYNTLIT